MVISSKNNENVSHFIRIRLAAHLRPLAIPRKSSIELKVGATESQTVCVICEAPVADLRQSAPVCAGGFS